MEDFLTTRQVQDVLKVDRITIYRMLGDGRLKGTKIGQQWRFSVHEVERLMNGAGQAEEIRPAPGRMGLPLHCIQTIQNLLAEVAGINALVVDMQGAPVTEPSGQYQPGAEDSQAWRAFAEASRAGQRSFSGANGLEYTGAPVLDGGEQIGLFLAGPFSPGGERPTPPGVPVISAARRAEVEAWPAAAVRAIHSVLRERTQFINRLQQIADLTHMHQE